MALSFYSILLHLLFFSLPLVATLKGKGTVVLIVLLCLLHLKDFYIHRFALKEKTLNYIKSPLGKWSIAFVLWCFGSSIWSEFSLRSLTNAGRYGLLGLVGFYLYGVLTLLSPQKKDVFCKAFVRGFVLYLAFFFVEIYVFPIGSLLYTDSSTFNSQLFIKGTVNFGFLFWPFLFFILEKYKKISFSKILFLSTVLIGLILLKTKPDAARAGFLLAFFGSWIVYYKPKATYAFSVVFVLFSLITPWIFKSHLISERLGEAFHYLPTSYQHRLIIWHEMGKKTLEHPLLGHGFDYGTTLTKGPIMCLKAGKINWSLNPQKIELIPPYETGCSYVFSSHPHNGIVQVWIELGLIGVLLLLCIFWTLVLKIARMENPRERATYFGLLLFYEIMMLVSSGLWQKWIGATVILALLAIHVVKKSRLD